MSFKVIVFASDRRKIENSLEIEGIFSVYVYLKEGFSVIVKELFVKAVILFFGASTRSLLPKRSGIIYRLCLGIFVVFVVAVLVVNIDRHKRAVFVKDAAERASL